MPQTKINYRPNEYEVNYDDRQWALLKEKREQALSVSQSLNDGGISILIYGSTARGNVNPDSDLDIVIMNILPSYQVELVLESGGLQIIGKEIIQATPGDAIKGYIYLPGDTSITIFLTPPNELSYEFYKFGGTINFESLKKEKRVAGVDKTLTLIIPNEKGHTELNLFGNEKLACKMIGIQPRIIEVRKRVLQKRDKVGRTGVYLKHALDMEQSFEKELKKIADKNSAVKRKIR